MMAPVTRPAALGPSRVYTLHPGDVVCADRDERLETLLGSCVTLLFTDPRRTVGAMCHVVHARPPLHGDQRNTAHGDAALARLGTLLRARGIEPRLCEAWVFGGGNMFPALMPCGPGEGHVGTANVAWALDRLHAGGMRVLGTDLGGNAYRKVGWTVGDGLPEVTVVAT
jgi:chemotaxis protein CheD